MIILAWQLLVYSSQIKDATPVILIAIVMFILPAGFKQFRNDASSIKRLLDWQTVQRKMPWGTIVLLGGGLALAEGTKVRTRDDLTKYSTLLLDIDIYRNPDCLFG